MKVSVFKPAGRKNYVCQWSDPITGRKKTRSAGTNIKRDAERFAGNLERELQNGTYHEDVRMTWETFRDRFEAEYLPGCAKSTGERYRTAFQSLERAINPKLLASINESVISQYQTRCRSKYNNSEATIKSNLVHIKAALNWAVEQKFIPLTPKFRMPKNSGGMKGRPITAEEFDRLIEKVDSINSKTPDEWKFLLRGLWWSGLRLGEALNLHWTDMQNLCVNLESELIVIQAHAQKGRRYTETPMAPEFVDMLKEVPADQREGFVFNPMGARDRKQRIRSDSASGLISDIGEAAGVKVSETKSGKVKYASAHDLRRSFGFRWSRLVMPTELKELMRHENISTTMQFYVGQDARATVKRLREAVANTLANTTQSEAKTGNDSLTETVTR
ncbi:tyrosine-type recombinase/integrase [uncultured Rubinisphaera sp.]|uniref:tyrosine-type recombinase/integrase n=1 Tax=uncultured Rubinisphaera sp. TaxID=1678686 RepID=UPI0030D8C184